MKIIFARNNLRSYKCLNYLVKKKIVPFLIIAHKKNAIKIHEIFYKNQLINLIRFKIKVGTNANS